MDAVIQVQVPRAFKQLLVEQQGEERLPRWVLEALVVEAVREGMISRGRGGEILGMGFHQAEEFYANRGITYDFTADELEADRQALETVLKKAC